MFARQLDERRQIGGPADQWRGRGGQVARQTGEPVALALQRSWIRHHDAVRRYRVELKRAPDVLEPEPPRAYGADVAPVLDLIVVMSDNITPPSWGPAPNQEEDDDRDD
jgi:hypothetical protein